MFHLRLLGSPALERDDAAFTGRAVQRHRLALLALLALAPGRRLSRDRLIAYLWPERDTPGARNLLKVSTHVLRTELAGNVLHSEHDQLRLDDAVEVDATEFSAALARLEYARAVALYRGPFLDGFFLRDAPEFEEWAARERQRLAGAYGGALEQLAAAAEAAGDSAAAAGWWQQRAAHEPLDSRVALRLVAALQASGNVAGALRHAATHEALLREELGIEAPPELASAVARLRTLQATSSLPVVPAAPAPSSAAPGAPVALPPSPASPLAPAGRRRRSMRPAVAAALVLILALAATFAVRSRAEPVAARSIAVLPFLNMSPDPAHTYFSDGLSEQVILALSRIDGLQVAARTSSFALRNRELDVRAIGDTLRVHAVLEGSVLVDGDSLRVIAQLIDARTGYHIWSERYDGELRDAFAVQDRIAGAIADALHLRLSGAPPRLAVTNARALEAWDLYLRGLYLRNTLSGDPMRQALEYFDRAIAIEPRFALAYAAKASVLAPLAYFRDADRDSVVRELRTLTARALELDPTNGEAHASLGILKLFFDWDWAGAETALRRAIELNPNDAHAWHHLANYHSAMGAHEAARDARERAVQLDPLNPRTRAVLSSDYFETGDYERALEHARRAAQLDPAHALLLGRGPGLPVGAGESLVQLGRVDEALEEYVRVAALRGATADELEAMREAFAASGMTGFWKQWLAMDVRQSGAFPDPLRMAGTHLMTGDTAQALDWLDRAYDERNPGLIYLRSGPFAGLRAHPRVARIAQAMKFPD